MFPFRALDAWLLATIAFATDGSPWWAPTICAFVAVMQWFFSKGVKR